MTPARKLAKAKRTTSGVQPTIREGRLSDPPLAFWLIRALDRGFNGTMMLRYRGITHRLVFTDGVVTGIDSPIPLPLRADDDQVAKVKLNLMFGLGPDTHVALDGSAPEPADPVTVEPFPLIVRGLRAVASRTEPEELLAPLMGRALRLHPEAPIDELGLLSFERKIVAALRARTCTVAELSTQRFAHPRALSSTLSILHALRFFAGDEPVRAPSTAQPVTPPREPSSKEVVLDQVHSLASLQRRLEEMETETPYEILDAPLSATSEELKAAFAKQLFVYHPDRLRGRVSPELKRACAKICGRLDEARRQLDDEKNRQRHRELTLAGSSAKGRTEASAKASDRVAEAERCMRRRDFVVAEAHLLAAISAEGDKPSHHALLAWCRAQAIPVEEGRGIDPRYDPMLQVLRQSVRAEPGDAKARYFFAQVLLRSRRTEAAMKQFRLVLELQPQNVGAARELRLHEMRSRRKTSKGFFERVWPGGAHR